MPNPTLADPLPFNRVVWEIVRQIPTGQVSTYGHIASMIPTPNGADPDDYAAFGAQWVGFAMNAVSGIDEPSVPWHRVVSGKGGIAMSDTNPSSAIQRGRLRAEGVEFNAKELIDLAKFGWAGPDPAWSQAHGLLAPKPLVSTKKGKPTQKSAPSPVSTPSADDDNAEPTQLSLF